GFFSRLPSNTSSGTSLRLVFCASRPVPRRHVKISRTIPAPNRIGAHAPSNILRRLAEKKMTSTAIRGASNSTTCKSFHSHSRENDHGQQQGFGNQSIEWILHRRRFGQHLGALSKIVEQQGREHNGEPGSLYGSAPEMAEIGIKRLSARDHQEYSTQRDQPDM